MIKATWEERVSSKGCYNWLVAVGGGRQSSA